MRTLLALAAVLAAHTTAHAGLARLTPEGERERPECAVQAQEIAAGTRQPARHAVTIGNNRVKTQQLKNAVNDARLTADTLKGLGWSVTEHADLDRDGFTRVVSSLSETARKLCPHDTLLFYFSGYGFEVNGISYLTTTGTDWSQIDGNKKISVQQETAFLEQMIGLPAVLRAVEAHSGAKVVILDTCRDDPLASVRQTPADDQRTVRIPKNTLLAHSSETGELSMDEGPNPLFGPYAWALSQALKEKGTPAEEVFRKVRREVVAFSQSRNFKQSPFLSSTLMGELVLGAPPEKRAAVAPAPAEPAKPAPPSAPAATERRIALVIANAQYGDLPVLDNPERDAKAVAAALERVGFKVTLKSDLTLSLVNKALRDFGDEAENADWALVYFAGHGMELGGRTFLLPTDVELKQDKHADEEAVQLERIIDKVENAKYLGLIVLDACRNNPFLKRMKRTGRVEVAGLGRSRAGDEPAHGLGAVQLDKAGVLVAYSARHGTTAFDGQPGKLSPFAQSLIEEMEKPGIDVQMMLRRVRDRVLEVTGKMQEPFSYGSLPGREFVFKPR